jgi:hypothetical protein
LPPLLSCSIVLAAWAGSPRHAYEKTRTQSGQELIVEIDRQSGSVRFVTIGGNIPREKNANTARPE